MRVIAASVLAFEAIVVLLAIPVAVTLGGVEPALAITGGVALALLCVAAAGSLGRPWGYQAGWVVQGLVLASGLVVTSMFLVGGLFVGLWVIGLRVGRRGEQLHAERWAGVEDPSGTTTDTAG
jgi:Protein of unknown function (DUF4233)